jgi:hypothetical protein
MRNPLQEYRFIQRELRQLFDDFTRVHCPKCDQPCCRKPARISPNDILLAESMGWKPKENVNLSEILEEVAGGLTEAFKEDRDASKDPPCDFLGEGGCSFPSELRPFGCTAWICPIMYREMDRATIAKAKRLIRELDRAHARLIASMNRERPRSRKPKGISSHG